MLFGMNLFQAKITRPKSREPQSEAREILKGIFHNEYFIVLMRFM